MRADAIQKRRMTRRAAYYLARMEKSLDRKVVLEGAKITACSGVFHPGVSRSSKQFCEWIVTRKSKGKFLDIGTGTGILGIVAALTGFSHVTFVDRNPKAMACAKMNAQQNNVVGAATFCTTNIVDVREPHDVVAFASPYLWFGAPHSMVTRYGDLVHSMFDDGDSAKLEAIRVCSKILEPGGCLALQVGSMSREALIVKYAMSQALCLIGRHVKPDGREQNIILEFVR